MWGGLGNYFNKEVEEGKNDSAGAQPDAQGRSAISFDINEIEFEHLRKKRAFYKGVNIRLNGEKDKQEVIDFTDLPDILPLKAAGQEYSALNYDDVAKTTKSEEEQKLAKENEQSTTDGGEEGSEERPYIAPSHLFDYDNCSPEEQKNYLSRFELIKKRKVEYRPDAASVKMVALIVNTYSGKGASILDEITPKLDQAKVPIEPHLTESALDPFRIANTINFDNYSVLAIAGGDGSINEALNGMLCREDGKKLPIAIIPNGANNDIAASLGIFNTDIAIDFLKNAEAIAVDSIKVMIDRDDESDLPNDESRLKSVRHMLSGSSLSMPAKIESGAQGMKGVCGQSSYSIASYFQAFTCGFVQDTYDVEIDDKRFNSEGTSLMCINNSKNSQGGMIINPFACVNDGLIDITWITDPNMKGTFGVRSIMADARSGGGVQAYKKHSTYMRGRKIKVHFKDNEDEEPELSMETGEVKGRSGPVQVVSVDGEDLSYYGQISWECLPTNVEVMVNTVAYFLDSKTFGRSMDNSTKEGRIIHQLVEKIWSDWDKDNSGYLDREETKVFLQTVLKDIPGEGYDDSKFDDTFDAIDADGDGKMQKEELEYFIKELLKKQKKK